MNHNSKLRKLRHPIARAMLDDLIALLEKRIANAHDYLPDSVCDAKHDLNVLAEARLYNPKESKP
jgi:hypothetical protein